MSKIPADRKYAKSHEWIKRLPDGSVLVGITDFAQNALGDLVFVEVPKVGRRLAANEASAVVESVKAASDVYAPIEGEVTEVNTQLVDAPEIVNGDPYEAGWLWKMKPSKPEEIDGLLDASAYAAVAVAS